MKSPSGRTVSAPTTTASASCTKSAIWASVMSVAEMPAWTSFLATRTPSLKGAGLGDDDAPRLHAGEQLDDRVRVAVRHDGAGGDGLAGGDAHLLGRGLDRFDRLIDGADAVVGVEVAGPGGGDGVFDGGVHGPGEGCGR